MKRLRVRYGRANRRGPKVGQVVVAWRADTVELVNPHLTRVDLGERHKTRPTVEGKSVMWARQGGESDVEKAEAYARSEETTQRSTEGHHYRVFVYPATEKDPLGRARREVVR